MSGGMFRARKRIKAEADELSTHFWERDDLREADALQRALDILDEEIEKDAETEFTRSIKPVEFSPSGPPAKSG